MARLRRLMARLAYPLPNIKYVPPDPRQALSGILGHPTMFGDEPDPMMATQTCGGLLAAVDWRPASQTGRAAQTYLTIATRRSKLSAHEIQMLRVGLTLSEAPKKDCKFATICLPIVCAGETGTCVFVRSTATRLSSWQQTTTRTTKKFYEESFVKNFHITSNEEWLICKSIKLKMRTVRKLLHYSRFVQLCFIYTR